DRNLSAKGRRRSRNRYWSKGRHRRNGQPHHERNGHGHEERDGEIRRAGHARRRESGERGSEKRVGGKVEPCKDSRGQLSPRGHFSFCSCRYASLFDIPRSLAAFFKAVFSSSFSSRMSCSTRSRTDTVAGGVPSSEAGPITNTISPLTSLRLFSTSRTSTAVP